MTRKTIFAAILVAVASTSCSGASTPAVENGGSTAVDEPALLRITRLVVHDGENPLATLTDEGRIYGGDEASSDIVGTLSPEGRLVDPQGTLIGTLQPDGRWEVEGGQLAATIGEDGSVTAEELDAPLTIRADGVVLMGDAPAEGLQVQGLTEHNRRAAGILLFLTVQSVRELMGAIAHAAEAADEDPGVAALRDGHVDCSRIEDAVYRQHMLDAGIDPDSIDCNENDE